jgi:glutamate-1-semialdehyde 2,1-aminomutase
VQERVHQYDQRGVIYGLDHPLEIKVAKKIRTLIPSAEMVRYFVTGTEATMNAIKIARAHTGKEKIIKFEGHYHGFHDYVSFSVEPSPNSRRSKPQPDLKGIPRALQKLVIVREWNDFDAVEKAVKRHANTTAAIITEPVMANSSVIPPQEGYLKFLKELCEKNDIVLIFDEVKTGFRVSRGGAQELFKVNPHLTALAKSFGNGYPISAVVGSKEIMEKNASREVLPQGTYARNPVSLAAADATMDAILDGAIHSQIEKFGTALIRGLQDILYDKKLDAIVQGYPSMFQLLFTKREQVRTYREFSKCDQKLFGKLQKRLLRGGVMIDESNAEPLYTSSAHSKEDLHQTLAIFESSLPA